ncbi:hypothetical protein SAMD00019534_094080, partial [Acytostelium subglobosum LB1]|uniref:hypothetical protein n=1 Tax=Acytostelium subglobosum LB1 TaxID=1410327 RepID=UPI000644D754
VIVIPFHIIPFPLILHGPVRQSIDFTNNNNIHRLFQSPSTLNQSINLVNQQQQVV